MTLCLLLFVGFATLLAITSFSSLRRNKAVDEWLARAVETSGSLLLALATTSTADALSALSLIVGAAGATLLAFAAVSEGHIDIQVHTAVAVAGIALLWCAVSVRAWLKSGVPALYQTSRAIWQESRSHVSAFLAVSLVVVLLVAAAAFYIGNAALSDFIPLFALVISGVVTLVLAIFLVNTAPLIVAFAPAWIILAYVWVAIRFAGWAHRVGRNSLWNAIIVFALLGTLYFTAISFPVLREALDLRPICG